MLLTERPGSLIVINSKNLTCSLHDPLGKAPHNMHTIYVIITIQVPDTYIYSYVLRFPSSFLFSVHGLCYTFSFVQDLIPFPLHDYSWGSTYMMVVVVLITSPTIIIITLDDSLYFVHGKFAFWHVCNFPHLTFTKLMSRWRHAYYNCVCMSIIMIISPCQAYTFLQ